MPLGKTKIAVGLDIGQATTKLVVLRRSGQQVTLVKAATLSNWQEGIVSEQELGEHLGTWIREQGVARHNLVVGVPQYLAIAQLTDFPPATRPQLRQMVAIETQQVAGLSDESFLHDYQQLTPFDRYRNPVLIGVCRASVLRQRLAPLLDADLHVTDLIMEGQALALTLVQQVPAARQQDELHLVLDVGTENTTLAVVRQDRLVHVASFAAGGAQFTAALVRHLRCTEAEAERTKADSRILLGHQDSPLLLAARAFANELHGALEHWAHQGQEDGAEPPRFAALHLTGGGAQLGGLPEFLGAMFDCPAHYLAPPAGGEPRADAQYAIAYGLALSALGPPAARLSLAPPEIIWTAQRRRRVIWLYAAVAILALTLGLFLTTTYARLQHEARLLADDGRRLNEAKDLIPQVQAAGMEIDLAQRYLLPFASRGNRNQTTVQALALLSRHQHKDDWLVFLADERTYLGLADPLAGAGRPSEGAAAAIFGGTRQPEKTQAHISVTTFRPWRHLVAAGFTPPKDAEQWASVRQAVDGLNGDAQGLFAGVDILAEGDRSPLDFRVTQVWREMYRMKSFALRLPLRHPEYSVEGGP